MGLQVGVQLMLLWMLYFFTGMALRESVLKVNGSAIRAWCASLHLLPPPHAQSLPLVGSRARGESLCAS